MSDEPEGTAKTWAVKNFPNEARSAAIAAARREGVDNARWLARAVMTQIQEDLKRETGLVAPAPVVDPVTQADVDVVRSYEALFNTPPIRPEFRHIADAVTAMTHMKVDLGIDIPRSATRILTKALKQELGRMVAPYHSTP